MRVFEQKFLTASAGGLEGILSFSAQGKKEPSGDKGRSKHPWGSQKEVNFNTKAALNSKVTWAGTKLDDETIVSPDKEKPPKRTVLRKLHGSFFLCSFRKKERSLTCYWWRFSVSWALNVKDRSLEAAMSSPSCCQRPCPLNLYQLYPQFKGTSLSCWSTHDHLQSRGRPLPWACADQWFYNLSRSIFYYVHRRLTKPGK